MRLVFFGTPEIAVPTLDRLLKDGHEIAAVFTQPDRPSGRGYHLQPSAVKTYALSQGLPLYQPEKIRTPEFRELLSTLSPEIAIVVAYGRIIPEWILEIPQFGFINSHFSLLPAYRGAAPINWAIACGEKITGVSVMKMVKELDAGDILLQQPVEIVEEETAPELAARLSLLGAELISKALHNLHLLKPVPQDHSKATFAPILKREDGKIVWQQLTASQVCARVRGFQPWPGTFCFLGANRLFIWKASAVAETCKATAGTVVNIDKNAIFVACAANTLLQIQELQLEGRKRLAVKDFLNGVRLTIGQSLEPTNQNDRN
ncbi:MAG: methionyl-tRNA formyltransferase [Acidobacteriota bacterium]|nr:methionyl-tRNA formyltransferase [Blastocatellia bacterium]MDW8411364.1 methionyl-tRNA formyltransferase [Acidobacteriota bacterium]